MRYEEALHMLSEIVEQMPKGYPRPHGVLHPSSESLVAYMGYETPDAFQAAHGYHPGLCQAFADDERNRIHFSLNLLYEPVEAVATVLLHELGHLYYSAKHGTKSPQANSEKLADGFARKWRKKLKLTGV